MATPAFFGNGFLQFGREAVWGTEVNASKRIPCVVLDIQSSRGKIRSNSMDGERVRGALYAGGHRARAVIEIEMQYITGTTDPSGILMLHDAIFGTGTFGAEGFASTAGPTYTHTLTIGDVMNSLTLELGDGAPGGDVDCVLLLGAKVAEAVWSFGASYEGDDNVLKLRLTLVGYSTTSNTAITGALTAQTIDPIMSHHATTYADGYGGTTSIWNSVTWTYKTGILEDGHYIGSQYIREPVASDFATCEVELTGDFDSWTHFNALMNHTVTSGNLIFTWSKPGGTEQYQLSIVSGYGYVVDQTHPLTTPGIVRQTVRFESVRSADLAAMKCAIVCEAPASEG